MKDNSKPTPKRKKATTLSPPAPKADKKASKELVTNIYKLHECIDWQSDRITELEGLVAQNAVDYQRAVKHIAENDKLVEELKTNSNIIAETASTGRKVSLYTGLILGFFACIGCIYLFKGLSLLINLIF